MNNYYSGYGYKAGDEFIAFDDPCFWDDGTEETAYCEECPVCAWEIIFDCTTCPFQDMKEHDMLTVYEWYLHVAREGSK